MSGLIDTETHFYFSNDLTPEKARELLIKGICEALRLCRFLYKGNTKILEQIDEAYEAVLVQNIKFIPKDWIVGCYKTYYTTRRAVLCFDFRKVYDAVFCNDIFARLWFPINSFSFIHDYMIKTSKYSDRTEHLLEEVLNVFRPICMCIDHMAAHPKEIMERVLDLYDCVENDDIFKD